VSARGIARKHLTIGEVGGVPGSLLAAQLEAGVVFHDDLARLRSGHGPENMAIVKHMAINLMRSTKATVEHPVEAVLDGPVGTDSAGEGHRIEVGGTEIVASGVLASAAPLGPALHHAVHGEARERRLAREAPVGEQPAHVMADAVRSSIRPWSPSVVLKVVTASFGGSAKKRSMSAWNTGRFSFNASSRRPCR
jgi:hypothetical protein